MFENCNARHNDNLLANTMLSMRFLTAPTSNEARGTYHHKNYSVDGNGRQ